LEDSPSVLGVVLAKGQRIVNGLLDILKLNLIQVIYLALLLFGVSLFAQGYPYRSGQGTPISIITVAIPSLALTLGAAAGVLPSANLGRLLARFVLPTGVLTSLAAFIVYNIFLTRSGEIAYAQLGATYTLVACGLGTMVFVKPPRPGAWSGGARHGALWPVGLAIVLMLLFLLISSIPLAQKFLYLGPLQAPEDYVTVALAFALWALALRFTLFLIPVDSGYQTTGRAGRKGRS
jgi:cation-transporting ATPase E